MPCTCVEECDCVCNCKKCEKGLLCDFDHYDDCEYRCDFCRAEQYEDTEQTNRKLFI